MDNVFIVGTGVNNIICLGDLIKNIIEVLLLINDLPHGIKVLPDILGRVVEGIDVIVGDILKVNSNIETVLEMHVPWVPIPNRTVALVEDTRSNPIMKHEFGLPMDPENSQTSFQTVNIQEAS